jgi:hypothetical protein
MDLTITNLASTTTHVGDFYGVTLAPTGSTGDSQTLTNRTADELQRATRLQALLAAGTVTLTVTPSSDELASGLLAPEQAVEAVDMAPVAASDVAAGVQEFFLEFTAPGVGGSPADVDIYAVNTLPYKVRILDAIMLVSTAVVASSSTLEDEAAGAGTTIMTFDSGTVGRKVDSAYDATFVLSPGATKGLILRLSDDAVAGSVIVRVRRES